MFNFGSVVCCLTFVHSNSSSSSTFSDTSASSHCTKIATFNIYVTHVSFSSLTTQAHAALYHQNTGKNPLFSLFLYVLLSFLLNKHYELIKYRKKMEEKRCGWKTKWVDENKYVYSVLTVLCVGRDRYTSINKTINGTSERPGMPFKFRWHIFFVWFDSRFLRFHVWHTRFSLARTNSKTHSTHASCECQDGLKDAEAFHFIYCVILSCVFSPPPSPPSSPTSSSCTSFFFYHRCHRRRLRLHTGIYVICRFCLQIFFLSFFKRVSPHSFTLLVLKYIHWEKEILCHLQQISIKIKFKEKDRSKRPNGIQKSRAQHNTRTSRRVSDRPAKFTVSQSFSIAIKFKCQMTPSAHTVAAAAYTRDTRACVCEWQRG